MSNTLARAAVLASTAMIVAAPAFAQINGGVGNSDPAQIARTLVTLFLGVCTVAAMAYWGAVGVAHFRGGGIASHWIWGGGVGTAILGGCIYIATQVLGGGGISL